MKCYYCSNPAYLNFEGKLVCGCIFKHNPMDQVMSLLVKDYTHPSEFTLILKAVFEYKTNHYGTQDELDQMPLGYAMQAGLFFSQCLGAWFTAFHKKFDRSPYAAEIIDPMERKLSPGVDWENIDRRTMEEAAIIQFNKMQRIHDHATVQV